MLDAINNNIHNKSLDNINSSTYYLHSADIVNKNIIFCSSEYCIMSQ